MVDEQLRAELVAMEQEDRRVRGELAATGHLGGEYVPRMEELHRKNAARLRELIARHGWPSEDRAGKEGAESAWFIAQHAVGEPHFQREALRLLQACAGSGAVPGWHAAYLEDRIAMHEGRPQQFGTQWLDDPRDGRTRPWTLVDPTHLNEWRRQVGLGPLRDVPPPGPDLPLAERTELERIQTWWREWLDSKGWRRSGAQSTVD
jgi:uncharacterized protein DUF6624